VVDDSEEDVWLAVNVVAGESVTGGPWEPKKPPTPTTTTIIPMTITAEAIFPIPMREVLAILLGRPESFVI